MKKVLVIDDDKSIRDAFELAMEDTDYICSVAENGRTGIELAKEIQPDFIFLDLKMPDIDGVETMRALRQAGIDCTIYIVTAFIPEYLAELSKAAKEGLKFGLGQKPLANTQILLILESNLVQ